MTYAIGDRVEVLTDVWLPEGPNTGDVGTVVSVGVTVNVEPDIEYDHEDNVWPFFAEELRRVEGS